jgi:hypothetical protein
VKCGKRSSTPTALAMNEYSKGTTHYYLLPSVQTEAQYILVRGILKDWRMIDPLQITLYMGKVGIQW